MKYTFFIFITAVGINAATFKADVLSDIVSEMNSLTLSKDAIVQRAYHNIDGEPVQCLRFALSSDSSQTSLFARIRINNLVKKNAKFICAVGSAINISNENIYFRIVSNGSSLFSKKISSNTIDFISDSITVDNSGGAELSFEIYYKKPEKYIPIDIILPVVFEVKKYSAITNLPDIIISGNNWQFYNKEADNTGDKIYFVPNIKFEKIISKSIFPQAGTPVKIIAVIKNSGWGDYHSSSGNTVFVSVNNGSTILQSSNNQWVVVNNNYYYLLSSNRTISYDVRDF